MVLGVTYVLSCFLIPRRLPGAWPFRFLDDPPAFFEAQRIQEFTALTNVNN